MAVKFISFEESQQQIKPKEFVSFEESQQEIAEPTNKFVPFEEYKATIETEVQTFVPYEEASTFKPFIPFDDAMGLPSQEEVMKAHAELRKPLQDITPSRGGLLTKEIVEKWGAIQQENPEAVNWKYIPVDVSYKEYNNVVSGLLFDKLQRGEFGVANAMDKVMTGDDNAIKGAIDGLTGKEKRDFYDIAIGLGFGKWQSLAIGMVAGVVLDPVNYIPFGTAFKFMSKTIGKTKAMDAIKGSNIANFLRKGFTSGEGAPPALHELTKTLKKYKRYEETKIYEEVEGLSKLMKNKKNAELITQVRAGKLAIEDLTPEAAATLKKIDDGYAKIGADAVKAGILKQEDLIENYQHGFYFTGDTALTKINSNIKNGHAGAPAFAHMRNVGNVVDYSNARLDLIKNVERAIGDNNIDEARKLIETFPLAKGQTLVSDASTYTAKQLLAKAKAVPRPNLNALENYGYRKLEHVAAMFRQKFINTVVDPSLPYATPISKMTSKSIRPGNSAYMVKYRIPDINLKEADEAGIALFTHIANKADNDIIELSPKLADDILNSPYMQKLFKGKGPRLFEMPSEIVDYMNETTKLFTTKYETLNIILSEASRIQDMWKPLATVARPFWHVRNITFNQMQLYLSGVSPFDLAQRAIEAFKSVNNKAGYLDTKSFGKVDLKKLGIAAKKNGLFGVGFAGGDLSSQASAIKKIQRAADPAKITLSDVLQAPKKGLLKPAEFFEDNAHMVGFLDYVAKSHDPNLETAILNGAKHAFKYLYDYGDLSTFEKGPMKLLVPFYSWTRKTLGLYAGDILEQPQKYANIGKLRKTLGRLSIETEQEKALQPDWMKEQGYMKVPEWISKWISKKPIYFYLAMPPDDLQILMSFKDMWGAVTPYKAIFEIIAGVKSFPEFGTKIEGVSPAPAWMTFLPEKTWGLLKLRPGRYIDYNSGISKDVLMIPNKYLYAIETAFPPVRSLHNWYPQAIELSQEKATAKVYSEATGISLVNENINQWRNNIVFEIKELQAELIKKAKIYEGVNYNGQVYNYVNETAEGQDYQRKIIELSKKLSVKPEGKPNVPQQQAPIKQPTQSQQQIKPTKFISFEESQQQPDYGYGKRENGEQKGLGYFGELKRLDNSNDVSTEISIGININGKEIEVPSLVPTLNKDEIKYLLSNPLDEKIFQTLIGKQIQQKAADYARKRIAEGKSPFKQAGEQISKVSQPSIGNSQEKSNVLDIMKQGVVDPPTILNYLNYDNKGNPTGANYTLEEVKALMPKANKIPSNTMSKVEELTGLKLKDRNIFYSTIEMNKQVKGTPLGQQNKNVIIVNSNMGNNPAGETSESSLIHELMHNILYQNGLDKTMSKEEQEAIVKDSEYYYLAGGKGIAPAFKKLQLK